MLLDLFQALLEGWWAQRQRARDRARCPACKKHGTRQLERQEEILTEEEYAGLPHEKLDPRTREMLSAYWQYYRCRNCGHQWRTMLYRHTGD